MSTCLQIDSKVAQTSTHKVFDHMYLDRHTHRPIVQVWYDGMIMMQNVGYATTRMGAFLPCCAEAFAQIKSGAATEQSLLVANDVQP